MGKYGVNHVPLNKTLAENEQVVPTKSSIDSSGKTAFQQIESTLANGASIDSGWIDTEGWSKYQITYFASAALSLVIESRAADSGSADLSTPASYSGVFYLASLPPRQRYIRLILTNSTGSSVTNAILSINAIYGGAEGASVFPIEIPPSQFSPAVLNQSVLIGKNTGGSTFQNVTVNQAGALLVGDFNQEVARGTQTGYTLWNKFGYNSDIDSASGETIWAVGGNFQRMTSADTLDIVSSSANDDDGGTGVNSVVIYGVDENWAAQIEVITMDGTTTVTTSNQWLGVNRVAIFLAGSGETNAGNITVTATTAATTQAYLPAGDGVTQQCIFFVPADTNFITEWVWVNCLKLTGGGGSPRVQIKMQVYSAVNNAQQEVFRAGLDTDVDNILDLNPNLPFPIGEKSIVWLEATTDQNNTEISARFSGTLIDDAV